MRRMKPPGHGLDWLFTLPPAWVALVLWSTGWGSLVLLQWRLGTLGPFLRNPAYMLGDFILLPLVGSLVAMSYRAVPAIHPATSGSKPRRLALALATLTAALTSLYSLLVSGNYYGGWSVPHTLFIWLFAYMIIGFAARGVSYLWLNGRRRSRAHARADGIASLAMAFAGITMAIGAHALLKLVFVANGAALG